MPAPSHPPGPRRRAGAASPPAPGQVPRSQGRSRAASSMRVRCTVCQRAAGIGRSELRGWPGRSRDRRWRRHRCVPALRFEAVPWVLLHRLLRMVELQRLPAGMCRLVQGGVLGRQGRRVATAAGESQRHTRSRAECQAGQVLAQSCGASWLHRAPAAAAADPAPECRCHRAASCHAACTSSFFQLLGGGLRAWVSSAGRFAVVSATLCAIHRQLRRRLLQVAGRGAHVGEDLAGAILQPGHAAHDRIEFRHHLLQVCRPSLPPAGSGCRRRAAGRQTPCPRGCRR